MDHIEEAWKLAQKIDMQLPSGSRTSWRWRLLFFRAKIDHILQQHGHRTDKAKNLLIALFDELERLYYVNNKTYGCVRPLRQFDLK